MKWESAPTRSIYGDTPADIIGLLGLFAVLIGAVIYFEVRRRSIERTRRASKPAGGPACAWRRDKHSLKHGFTAWRCETCGADGFSSDGLRPKECKRGLKSAL
jgi:hypothetical protein